MASILHLPKGTTEPLKKRPPTLVLLQLRWHVAALSTQTRTCQCSLDTHSSQCTMHPLGVNFSFILTPHFIDLHVYCHSVTQSGKAEH